MPFGLQVYNVLRGLTNTLVCLDDILIYTTSLQDHLDTKDPLTFIDNEMLYSNYINKHREFTKLIYQNLNEKCTLKGKSNL